MKNKLFILKNYKKSLEIIQERKSEYVLKTDIPPQLVKEERELVDQIKSIESTLNEKDALELEHIWADDEQLDFWSDRDALWHYLNNIIRNLEAWDDLYTPLAMKTDDMQNIAKDLRLPLTFKSTGEEQALDIWEAVKKYNKFIIVGDPGAGKTTTLSYLYIFVAREAFKSPDFKGSKIPVLVKLNLFSGDIYELMKSSLKENAIEINTQSLHIALKKGGFVFFLDGLNEIPLSLFDEAVNLLNLLHSDFPNNQYIYTSRYYNYNDDLAIPILHIQKLDKDRIVDFIDRYLKYFKVDGINGQAFFHLIDGKIQAVISNPLMLFMLLRVYFNNKSIPQNRSFLYDEFVTQILEEWEAVLGKRERGGIFSPEIKIRALSHIAFGMQDAQIISSTKQRVLESIQSFEDMKPVAEEILEELFCNRLLESNNNTVTFTHQSFQEFFAAKYLLEMFNEGNNISFAFDTPGWEEPIILLSGLLENSSKLIFEHIMDKNLYLAGEAIVSANKVDNNVKVAVMQVLYEKLGDPLLRTREISRDLIKKIDGDTGLLNYISNIGEKYSEEELLLMLDSNDWFDKLSAIIGLTKKNNTKAIPYLVKIVSNQNEKPAIRWRASNALRQLPRDKDTVELLIRLCDTDDERIKWPCIHGLGVPVPEMSKEDLLDEYSVNTIISFLEKVYRNESNKNIRYGAVRVLAEIGGVRAVELLSFIVLKDTSKEVRERAAAGLGLLKNEAAAEALMASFVDPEWKVRREAVRSFGLLEFKNKSNTVVPQQLRDVVNDKDWRVCLAAIDTMARLKLKGSRDIFMKIMASTNYRISDAASKAILEL